MIPPVLRKPPPSGWRPWIYMAAYLGGGVASTLFAIWLVTLVRYGWPVSAARQQLGILGNALYLALGGALLVLLGLVIRNSIRNLRASGAGFEIEARAHSDKPTEDDAP